MAVRVTRIENSPGSDIVFRIDFPADNALIGDTRRVWVAGWAVSEKEKISEIRVRGDDRVLQRIQQTVFRPKVKELHPNHLHSDRAGFGQLIDATGVSELVITGLLESGEERRLATLVLSEFGAKRLLYVHVAKTAGTSLNSVITSHLEAGDYTTHLESVPGWRTSKTIPQQSFISGHVRYEVLKEHFDINSYVKIVTFRQPLPHVISHLAWIRHLSDEGNEKKLAAHTESIQILSGKLRETDLSSPRQLSAIIEQMNDQELALLDNTQTRYVCRKRVGRRVTERDLGTAVRNLREFDIVGTAERFGDVVSRVCAVMNWEVPASVPRDNVQAKKYGLDNADPDIHRALLPLIAHDEVLYKHVCRHYATTSGSGKMEASGDGRS